MTCSKHNQHFDDFMAQILSAIASKVITEGVELSFSGKCGDAEIALDPVLMEQAVLNIIDNALKHGGDGLKMITVTTRKIRPICTCPYVMTARQYPFPGGVICLKDLSRVRQSRECRIQEQVLVWLL